MRCSPTPTKVDEKELANAIKMATGAEPDPRCPRDEIVPRFRRHCPSRCPRIPIGFTLCRTLTDEERLGLRQRSFDRQSPRHTVGGSPDHYNRLHLGEMQQANRTEIDRLAATRGLGGRQESRFRVRPLRAGSPVGRGTSFATGAQVQKAWNLTVYRVPRDC